MANTQNDREVGARTVPQPVGAKTQGRPMKSLPLLILLTALLALNGCARYYVITLTNGRQIGAIGKPRLQGNAYTFKNMSGRASQISSGRVAEIAPASMTRDNDKTFTPAPVKR
jgi:hypothetical protein